MIYLLRHGEDDKIEERELNKLNDEGYLGDIYEIYKMYDLLGMFIGNYAIKYDLFKKMPEQGYIRAKRFIRMINKELDFNLSIDKIMNVDYYDTGKVKQLVKKNNY